LHSHLQVAYGILLIQIWPLVVVRLDLPRGVGEHWAASPSSATVPSIVSSFTPVHSNPAVGAATVAVDRDCGYSVSASAAARCFGISFGEFCVTSSFLPFTPDLAFTGFFFFLQNCWLIVHVAC